MGLSDTISRAPPALAPPWTRYWTGAGEAPSRPDVPFGALPPAVAVSQRNIDALRTLYQRLAHGDVWAAGELLAPDVVSSWPEPGGRVVCRGQDELRARLRALLEHWTDYRAEAREFDVLDDDSVLVAARQYATAVRSGVEVESAIFTVWIFKEGRVVSQHWALRREEALEAAGLAG